MKYFLLSLFSVLLCTNSFGQYSLSEQQKYMINEWKDAYGGQVYYAYNYPKAYKIYKQLVSYSGMDYPIIFSQTFNWGQAHRGGLIIIDYSTINKSKSILAFVFAHEWGHQALGHQANVYNPFGSTWKYRSSPTQDEDEADYYSGKFLAAYGYNLEVVYDYLSSLPNFGGHTHSTGEERAETVRRGYRSYKSSTTTRYKTIVTQCTHIMHPNGDLVPCTHIAHPRGDLIQCMHACYNPLYGNVPCHPNGDITQCTHKLHYRGDLVQCRHLQHPAGDTKRVTY